MNEFQRLVGDLSAFLGPSSGLDSREVNPSKIEDMMREYVSKEHDWKKFAFGDSGRAYTRNLVDVGNGKSNLLVLVWTPGKGSPIHDHANAHCVMKILQGTLKETLYDTPKNHAAPGVKKVTTLRENEVAYMSDELGLHKISNPDPYRVAISLHLYTPPNASKHGCYVYDETTDKRTHVKQCDFYSKSGIKAH